MQETQAVAAQRYSVSLFSSESNKGIGIAANIRSLAKAAKVLTGIDTKKGADRLERLLFTKTMENL
jgi:hypothetical protein